LVPDAVNRIEVFWKIYIEALEKGLSNGQRLTDEEMTQSIQQWQDYQRLIEASITLLYQSADALSVASSPDRDNSFIELEKSESNLRSHSQRHGSQTASSPRFLSPSPPIIGGSPSSTLTVLSEESSNETFFDEPTEMKADRQAPSIFSDATNSDTTVPSADPQVPLNPTAAQTDQQRRLYLQQKREATQRLLAKLERGMRGGAVAMMGWWNALQRGSKKATHGTCTEQPRATENTSTLPTINSSDRSSRASRRGGPPSNS
jgi:hypothetical protein